LAFSWVMRAARHRNVVSTAHKKDSRGLAFVVIATVVLAVAARLTIAWLAPAVSPDGGVYLIVADNIRLNGCLSLSDPTGGQCVPHWGGNHPPGYPIMLWLSWLPFGRTEFAGLAAQSILFALAAGWMARAAALYSGSMWMGLAAGFIVALSPVQVAWARFVLPETLALTGTIWLFAELMLSLEAKKLRIVPIGLALGLAFFARYDNLLLILPVALCGFMLHRPVEALRRGMAVALIFSAPILIWSGYNVARGLSLVPDPFFFQDGRPTPHGYLAWGNTWITTIYQGGSFAYPLQNKSYDRIRIDPAAYDSTEERTRIEALLARLSSASGEPFPAEIDAEFAEIAASRRNGNPLRHWVGVPLQRMVQFWINPYYSFGWPIEIDSKLTPTQRELLANGSVGGVLQVARAYAVESAVKAGITGYRYVLLALGLGIVGLALGRKLQPVSPFVWLVATYVVSRTIALSLQSSIDNRYMIEALAPLEIAVALAVGIFLLSRRRATAMQPDG